MKQFFETVSIKAIWPKEQEMRTIKIDWEVGYNWDELARRAVVEVNGIGERVLVQCNGETVEFEPCDDVEIGVELFIDEVSCAMRGNREIRNYKERISNGIYDESKNIETERNRLDRFMKDGLFSKLPKSAQILMASRLEVVEVHLKALNELLTALYDYE